MTDLEALLRSVNTLDDDELSRMAFQDLSSLGDFSDLGRLDFDDAFSDKGPLDNDQSDDYGRPGHVQIHGRKGRLERLREGASTRGRGEIFSRHVYKYKTRISLATLGSAQLGMSPITPDII